MTDRVNEEVEASVPSSPKLVLMPSDTCAIFLIATDPLRVPPTLAEAVTLAVLEVEMLSVSEVESFLTCLCQVVTLPLLVTLDAE